MKKILVLMILFFGCHFLKAQESNTPAAQLAHHIADKMADTLGLSNQQRAKIFAINMDLHKQKTEARSKSQDRTVVGNELQRIEVSRDAMYKTVLTENQYGVYLQKKRYLVTSN
jgi:hypothetical protein